MQVFSVSGNANADPCFPLEKSICSKVQHEEI